MPSRLSSLVLAVLLAACGGASGPQPNAVTFWQITSSTVDFGQCSDDAQFRQEAQPISFAENSYIIYKVSADAKSALAQDCTHLDAKTCQDSQPPVLFQIAGRELTFTRETKDPVGGSGCNLQQAETWTLTDNDQTMSLEISNVLSLVDASTACDAVESDLKTRSPNMLGVQGCVVTFKLTGSRK
jgi:hypothetical protein